MSKDYGLDSSDMGGEQRTDTPQVDAPMAYSNKTRTTFGRETAWRSKAGVLSKQNFGTVMNFDDEQPAAGPQSDKGASFGGN